MDLASALPTLAHDLQPDSAISVRQPSGRGLQVTPGLPLQQYNADGEAAMLNRSRFRVQAFDRLIDRCLSTVATIAVLAIPAVPAAQGSGAPVSSFYDLKTSYLDGKPADLGVFRGKVTLVGQRRQQVRLHAAVRGARKTESRAVAEGIRRARIPEQRLRRAGARHGAGDRAVLQAHLRRDVPDVREGGDEGRDRTSRRSTSSSARPAICRRGTSASTSSARTARSSRSSRAT